MQPLFYYASDAKVHIEGVCKHPAESVVVRDLYTISVRYDQVETRGTYHVVITHNFCECFDTE